MHLSVVMYIYGTVVINKKKNYLKWMQCAYVI